MQTDMSKLHPGITWREITEGTRICAGGTSREFNTGEWTTVKAYIDEEKCKQCLLCVPVCPDSAIAVKDGRRLPVDRDHCKGCGICVKNCPFDAISMKEEERENG